MFGVGHAIQRFLECGLCEIELANVSVNQRLATQGVHVSDRDDAARVCSRLSIPLETEAQEFDCFWISSGGRMTLAEIQEQLRR